MKVAADAKDKLFIATPCCVQAMNNAWYDKTLLDQSLSSALLTILSILIFGLLAPVIIDYRESHQVRIYFKK